MTDVVVVAFDFIRAFRAEVVAGVLASAGWVGVDQVLLPGVLSQLLLDHLLPLNILLLNNTITNNKTQNNTKDANKIILASPS